MCREFEGTNGEQRNHPWLLSWRHRANSARISPSMSPPVELTEARWRYPTMQCCGLHRGGRFAWGSDAEITHSSSSLCFALRLSYSATYVKFSHQSTAAEHTLTSSQVSAYSKSPIFTVQLWTTPAGTEALFLVKHSMDPNMAGKFKQ